MKKEGKEWGLSRTETRQDNLVHRSASGMKEPTHGSQRPPHLPQRTVASPGFSSWAGTET